MTPVNVTIDNCSRGLLTKLGQVRVLTQLLVMRQVKHGQVPCQFNLKYLKTGGILESLFLGFIYRKLSFILVRVRPFQGP